MGSSDGQNPAFFLLATCDEILSWMIEIWMENHLGRHSKCNTVNLLSPQKNYKEWQIMLG